MKISLGFVTLHHHLWIMIVLKDILLVGAGSFLGGIARYLIALVMKGFSASFPWATMTANIAGCLLIGLLWATFNRTNPSSQLNLFLTAGFCGGFTTFSTFSKESLNLLQTGNYTVFCLYALGSVVLGILAVAIGFALAKWTTSSFPLLIISPMFPPPLLTSW